MKLDRTTSSAPDSPLIARIIGSDRCECENFTVKHSAPVLALCRKLVEAGYDPGRPLHAYRGSTLCLTVRSIGEAALLVPQSCGGFRSKDQ